MDAPGSWVATGGFHAEEAMRSAKNKEFCHNWLNGKLGRKTQQAGYYNQDFDHAEFLCYISTSEFNNPIVLAMRCKRTGVIVLDSYNTRSIEDRQEWVDTQSIVYWADFQAMDAQSKDLAEVRVVESRKIGNVLLVVFEANGVRWHTETTDLNYCASRADYLSMKDIAEPRSRVIFSLQLADESGLSIEDVRRRNIPEAIGDKDFKFLNKTFLVPAPDLDTTIPAEHLQRCRWKPIPIGWDLPRGMLSSNGSEISMISYRFRDTAFFLSTIEEQYPDDVKTIMKWREAYDRWSESVEYVRARRYAQSSVMEKGLVPAEDDCWRDEEDRLYARGKVTTSNRDNTLEVDVGPIWHEVVRGNNE